MSPALAAILDPERLMPRPGESIHVTGRLAAQGAVKARALRMSLARLGTRACEAPVNPERRSRKGKA